MQFQIERDNYKEFDISEAIRKCTTIEELIYLQQNIENSVIDKYDKEKLAKGIYIKMFLILNKDN